MASISQPLPDFRNLGVIGRLLLAANAAGLAAAVLLAPRLSDSGRELLSIAVTLEPALLVATALLALAAPWLQRLPPPAGRLLVIAVAVGTAVLLTALGNRYLLFESPRDLPRAGMLAALLALALLVYFDLRGRARLPVRTRTRLLALQARIRPHFLFNTLNAAISLIRSQPAAAEQALLGLADLFRAALRDPTELVRLDDELELARLYLDIERLRIGDRLEMDWQVDPAVHGARLPGLTLQPLLENAVYHGVEPRAGPSRIHLSARRRGRELLIEIRNPLPEVVSRPGHTLALDNIRQRLDLCFDAEATLLAGPEDGTFVVRMQLPWKEQP